jgi:hypothetical protein
MPERAQSPARPDASPQTRDPHSGPNHPAACGRARPPVRSPGIAENGLSTTPRSRSVIPNATSRHQLTDYQTGAVPAGATIPPDAIFRVRPGSPSNSKRGDHHPSPSVARGALGRARLQPHQRCTIAAIAARLIRHTHLPARPPRDSDASNGGRRIVVRLAHVASPTQSAT